MKFLLILFLASVALAEEDKHCYNEIAEVCRARGSAFAEGAASKCDSKYLAFDNDVVLNALERFAYTHLDHSYDHLLTAANFGNYNKNREGFQKYFQKLSDSAWEKTIDLVKYVSKRGGKFKLSRHNVKHNKDTSYEEFELGSMANALGMTKNLALAANTIHHEVGRSQELYDAEVSSYIEEHFVHDHSSLIRELSGHTNDLKKLYVSDNDISLALFLFDEYLKG